MKNMVFVTCFMSLTSEQQKRAFHGFVALIFCFLFKFLDLVTLYSEMERDLHFILSMYALRYCLPF